MSRLFISCRFALAGLIIAGLAYPAVPNCGDVITLTPGSTYVLTGNVGPCANGLRITGKGIFALNNHSIQGSFSSAGGATGIYLENASNVTIAGPGSIINFNTGVAIPPGTTGVVIWEIDFSNNRVSINADMGRDLHIRDNRIEQRDRGDWGIFLASCVNVKIRDNVIKGHYIGGISIGHSIDVKLTRNEIRNNLDGVVATASGEMGLVMLGNMLRSNYRDGVRISGSGGPPYTVVLEGNSAYYNSRDGLVLDGGPSVSYRAEDNKVYANERYGIFVTAGWNVVSNWLDRGRPDIFWTGGPGTTFAFNQCRTAGATPPAVAPACFAP